MKRRILSMLLAVCMVVSMLATAALAAPTYVDIEGHWGEEAIEYWSAQGVIGGVGGDSFNPDGLLTRGEAAAILARLLKLTEKADISKYTDCVAGAWYYEPIAKCVAAGIMNGTGATTMGPGDQLTRAQMFTMFCRAAGITGESTINKYFVDYNQTPAWAVESVNALVNGGYVGGTTATTLEPNTIMTRASLVVMLRKTIAAYVTEGGKVEVQNSGIVLVVTNEPTQVVFDSAATNTGAVVTTQPNATVQVSGNFSGTIVANQPNTNVSLSGLNGKVEVVANADNTTVVNAPAGTTVTSSNGAENVTVNDTKVETNNSETVGAPTTPVVPPYVPYVCPHSTTGQRSSQAPGSCYEVYCLSCGEVLGVVYCSDFTYTEPTCTEWGTRTCKVCKVTYTHDKAPLNHLDENNDNICDRDPSHKLCADDNHKWDDGVVTTEPTCTEDGVLTYTCSACGVTKTEVIEAGHIDENGDELCDVCVKFYLAVSSKDTTISATVYDDYGFVVSGLDAGAKVNASNVSATVIMQNVDSLKADYKKHSISVSTGLQETDTTLSNWLGNVYNFGGATVNVNINGKKTAYEIGAYAAGEIVGTTDEAATRAAWQELTSHIGTTTQATDDSKIVVANGSFIHIGNKVLHFETAGDLTIDNLGNMSGIQSAVRTALKLSDTTENGVKFYAAAGTQLAVGQSIATLEDPAVITIDGITLSDEILTTMQNADTTYALVSSLMNLVNEIVGKVDAAAAPGITIMFQETALPHVHSYVTTEGSCTTDSVKSCSGCDFEEVVSEAPGHYWLSDDTCMNCEMTKDEAMKFELAVTSGATVSATVYDDYAMEVVVPKASVDASSVTVTASMQNVGSLGVNGTRSHSLTVNTGTTGSPNLGSWLSYAFVDIDTDVIVKINGSEACVYDVTGSNGVITAAPTNVEDARIAWHTLVNSDNFATGTQASDSYFLINNTSYLIFDTEKLMFEDGAADLMLDNISGSNTGLADSIRASVKLVPSEQEDGVVLFVGAGTELAVGSSVAKLLKDVKIEIKGITVEGMSNLQTDVLAAIRDAEGTYNMLTILVKSLNSMIGKVAGMDTVTVEITIG